MQAWEERYYDKQEAGEEGLAEGRAEERKQNLKTVVEIYKEMQVPRDTVLWKIAEKFDMTEEEARCVLEENWQRIFLTLPE